MSEDTWTLISAIIGFGMAFLVGRIASRKGYHYGPWVLAGFVLWPVALPWILLKRDRKTNRQCMDCHAWVPFNAPVCSHCGRDERVTARHA